MDAERKNSIDPAADQNFLLDQRARVDVFEETFVRYVAQYIVETSAMRRPSLAKVAKWLEQNTLAIPLAKATNRSKGSDDMKGAMDWMSKPEPGVKWRRKFAR